MICKHFDYVLSVSILFSQKCYQIGRRNFFEAIWCFTWKLFIRRYFDLNRMKTSKKFDIFLNIFFRKSVSGYFRPISKCQQKFISEKCKLPSDQEICSLGPNFSAFNKVNRSEDINTTFNAHFNKFQCHLPSQFT